VAEGSRRGGFTIAVTFVVAYALAMVRLPDVVDMLRPDWVAMVLIYWCIATPSRVGPVVGWVSGLLLDVLRTSLLGQHALAFALVAYLAGQFHQRIRNFPLWQQSLVVFTLLGLSSALIAWIQVTIAAHEIPLRYWLTPVMSMIFWPFVFVLLRDVRRWRGVQ